MALSNPEQLESGASTDGDSQNAAFKMYESAYAGITPKGSGKSTVDASETAGSELSKLGFSDDLSFTGLDAGTSSDAATAERSRTTPSKSDPLESAKSGTSSPNEMDRDRSAPKPKEDGAPKELPNVPKLI